MTTEVVHVEDLRTDDFIDFTHNSNNIFWVKNTTREIGKCEQKYGNFVTGSFHQNMGMLKKPGNIEVHLLPACLYLERNVRTVQRSQRLVAVGFPKMISSHKDTDYADID